jgi:hypothetical protein
VLVRTSTEGGSTRHGGRLDIRGVG